MKTWFTPAERRFGHVIARLSHCNHFLPERIALEREALGPEFDPIGAAWNLGWAGAQDPPNLARLAAKTEKIVHALLARKNPGGPAATQDRALYEDLVAYHLYLAHRAGLRQLACSGETAAAGEFRRFREDVARFVEPIRGNPVPVEETALSFALLYQIERAFLAIFDHVVGHSPVTARLRAAVWESIFTHDLRRYRRGLYRTMSGLTTLITGPSGTGKELVARAIAQSGFIPFDVERLRFRRSPAELFLSLNLSALVATLIESELFGHRRGAFTGALLEHAGWLEACPPEGAVFLDEIGETSPAIQVKLLRVLQTRTFQRLGESQPRKFLGKLIAATNRELAVEVREGRCRSDFYYRLCSDHIVTPSLRDQLREAPDDLPRLVQFITRELCGPDESDRLITEVVGWIETHLPPDFAWPGNFRELEQCTRSILIRGRYDPLESPVGDAAADLCNALRRGELTAAQVLGQYCALVHSQTGNLEQTSRRLDLDRRTVRARLRAHSLGDGGIQR